MMTLGYVDSGSGELGSKNHDRDERLPGTCAHCEDGILAQCACCQFVLVCAGDGEFNNSRHVTYARASNWIGPSSGPYKDRRDTHDSFVHVPKLARRRCTGPTDGSNPTKSESLESTHLHSRLRAGCYRT